jgi:thiosulfate dehydrogenase [quinone] large subunit
MNESSPSSPTPPGAPSNCCSSGGCNIGPALGILTLRIWLGVRSLVTGIEKFAGTKASEQAVKIDGAENAYGLTEAASEKVYSLANYHGVPEALRSKFAAEPLLPDAFLGIYDKMLGPALLLLGFTVLVGILPRLSLFAMGLLYTSLTFGLLLIGQDGGVAWLAAHMILIAVALIYSDRDRFAILGKKW